MSDPKSLASPESLRGFVLGRVLNEDPVSNTIVLLGTLPSLVANSPPSPAILRIERTALSDGLAHILPDVLQSTRLLESTDIYHWLLAWFTKHEDVPDVKINIVCPATEVHIRKYSKQAVIMVQETPLLYERIVKPFIQAFPPSRTQWVENILLGKSEAEKILYRDEDLLILPDMKWDLTNTSTLYLVALVFRRDVRSMRDLNREHLPLLKNIRSNATRVVKERWSLDEGSLRFYVHYQPSYYHFHVHIVNANYIGIPGMTVGQAHLLEDLISLLELSPLDGPSILESMTFSYGLGEQHGLFESMKAAQTEINNTTNIIT